MNQNKLGDTLYSFIVRLLPFAFFALIAWFIFRALTGDPDPVGGPQYPQEAYP